jgi:CubicO group peptidase (beta-lactamase class C family)
MHDGKVVYSRAFGMANLEHDISLTPQSVFEVGSVSKQFTAASIALLALRGQLSLDDDIRTYVPEMPDFGETITIRHVVHHTSGMDSYGGLVRLSGWTDLGLTNNARILALQSRHRTLRFRPGEEELYSNGGYFLLAEIVKRVSGTSLREFAEENIFGPLGMANTHFDDDHTTIVKNRVQDYEQRAQGGLRRYVDQGDEVGAWGLLTTAEDLLRWARNFDDIMVGGPNFIELILTRGTLNNGDTINYSFGLRHSAYRGLKTVHHSGAWDGFSAMLLRFPEQRFAVAVLCNLAWAPTLASRVADIHLSDVLEAVATEDESLPAPKAVSVSTSELQKVTGHYWNVKKKRLRRIYVQDDTLRYLGGPYESKLTPLGNDRFHSLGERRIVSFTSPTPEQPRQMIVDVYDGEPVVYDAVEPVSPSPAELEAYLGTYFSEELDYEWVLRITNDGLTMWDPRTWSELALRPLVRDVFQLNPGRLIFTFACDDQGRVVSFMVDAGELRNVQFVRR